MEYKSKEVSIKRRKKLKALRRGFHDSQSEWEGNTYDPGAH